MSHTKGPWSASGLGIYAHDASTDGDVMVANCDDVDKRPQGEAEANARLIAAAPDLLEACNAVCQVMAYASAASLEAELLKAYNLCNAAVSKAEGKS